MNGNDTGAAILKSLFWVGAAFGLFWLSRNVYQELPAVRRYLRISRM